MMRQPTDSQWAAVRACEEHVLVEAGAGTGKTFTVVNRILYLLGVEIRGERYHAPVTLDDIVAITFTRQAAADLKRDLRAALRAVGRRADAYAVDRARIGTIHGFCSDLVREHALRSGRAPQTGVLEEGEALAWMEGCVRDELLAALETSGRDVAGHDRGRVDGLDVLLAKWDTAKVEQWALTLMRSDALPRLGADGHSPEEQALIELSRRAARRMEARLAAEGRIDYDRMIAWTRDLLRDERGVRGMLQRRVHTLIIDEFQDTDSVQREIAYLLAEPESGRADTPRLMLVGDPKQSIYRFRGADVTVWSGVRRDFEEHGHGRRLRLRDNFRSVPPILSLVEVTAGKWLNTPVEGDALADYEVAFEPVDAARDDIARDNAARDDLARDDAALDDAAAVEFVVVPANDEGKAQNAESRRALEAAAVARRLKELNRAGTPWRDMVLLLRTWGSMDVYAAAMRAAGIPVYALRDDDFLETREVLDLVVALRAIRDPRDDLAVFGFLRGPFVNLRDDTLLGIALSTKRPYARNLAMAASNADGATAAGADAAVASAAGANAAITDAAVANAAVENAIAYATLPERERVAAGITLLHELAELRDRIPAAALLDGLLHRTGYLAHLALLGDRGAQAALNVRRFLQMIGGMEESSVGMVLRAIGERRARKDRVPQARLHGEHDDVVLITSIHMAKGLDWPVVVYGDVGAWDWSDHDRLLVGRESIRLGEPDTTGKEQPERWQALRAQRTLEEEAEEKRVVYVGLTRPKDRLILAGIPQGSGTVKGVAWDLLAVFPTLADARDGDTITFTGLDGVARAARVHVATPDDAAGSYDVAQPTPMWTEPATLPPALVATPLGLTRHSATELLAFSRCERRHAFKYVYGIREPRSDSQADAPVGAQPGAAARAPVDGQAGAGINAITRGQIVHEVLERHVEDAELDALLEDAIGRWDEHAPPPDKPEGSVYRAELATEIERVLAMPEYAALANAAGARRELKFLHVLEDGAALQGAIDIAAPHDDGSITLADVKTSRITAGEAARKAAEYAPQQDVYVAGAAAIGPQKVRAFGFVFSRPGTSVFTPVEAGAVGAVGAVGAAGAAGAGTAAAEARVRSAVAAMGTVPGRLAANPRECFMCGYRKAGLCPGVQAEATGAVAAAGAELAGPVAESEPVPEQERAGTGTTADAVPPGAQLTLPL